MSAKSNRSRRKFTSEFKAEAVAMVAASAGSGSPRPATSQLLPTVSAIHATSPRDGPAEPRFVDLDLGNPDRRRPPPQEAT